MTTRLTNHLRGEIIKSALAGTAYGTQRAALEKEVKDFARKWVADRQPAGWLKVIKGHPKEWFQQQVELPCMRDKNPLSPFDSWNDCYRLKFDDPVIVAKHIDSTGVGEACAPFKKRAEQLEAQREEARRTLAAFLKSQYTVEALLKAMPELTPHVPKDLQPKKFPLVAPSNALSLLVKMGFDQSVKAK